MKKNSRIAIICILLSVFATILMGCSDGSDEDYARITDVDYTAVVVDEEGSEGKILITERLTFDIHAASESNLFWELWRDLPEDYIDGAKVDYTVHSVTQILEDGTKIPYYESDKLYWDDYDYDSSNPLYGPGKWFHSEGPYDEEAAQYECVLFYVDGIYREEMTFEIVYEMHNAAFHYNDCSDLYISLYSGETIEYLESFKAQILFPNKDMPAAGNYMVTTYGTNANAFPVFESATENPGYYTFSFELTEEDLQFKPYNQYIEFDLVSFGDDKHIFTEYAPSNYYYEDDVLTEIIAEQEAYHSAPARYNTIKKICLIVFSILSVLVLLWPILLVHHTKKKYTFYASDNHYEYYRDIPSELDPNFAAFLVFSKDTLLKDTSDVYSALLLSLARKKYVDLIDRADGNLLIHILHREAKIPSSSNTSNSSLTSNAESTEANSETHSLEPLTLCEEYYYNLLLRHAKGDHIHIQEFQECISEDYANTSSFAKKMKNSITHIGMKDGYLQQAEYSKPQDLMNGIGIFLLILGCIFLLVVNLIFIDTRLGLAYGAFTIFGISCIIAFFYLLKNASKYVLLTQKGEDEYEKWRGLYRYFKSNTFLEERNLIALPVLEQYLIYATAFGLADEIQKATKLRIPQTEYENNSIIYNKAYRSGRIHHYNHSFHSSVQVGASGSGGGYSGGYGGGGRGGGGGGGGH